MLPDEESPVAEIDARDPAAAQNRYYLFCRGGSQIRQSSATELLMDHLMPSTKAIMPTRTKAPSTDEIAINQRRLEDMVDILDCHNLIFRRMIYTGVLVLFCLAMYLIAIIERQLEAMLDSLVYPTSIYKAGFWAGLLLSIVSSIRLWTWRQDGSPRSFVERCVPWLVACELGLAVWILRLPPAPYRLAVDG